jgi:phosphoglycolate phosphatase-like HAD superfamily hydrolase
MTPTMMTPALVLFDIDGTLVLTGRAGVRGMNRAFQRLHGVADALANVPIAGRTDRAIVADGFRRMGKPPTAALITELRDAYCSRDLPEELVRPTEHPKHVLPGVEAALDALGSEPQVGVGLLTGNFVAGAAVKLGHFDLWRRFTFGAFGDEHLDRRDLMAVAVAAARRHGRPDVPPDRIVVIGDTPLDVDCAQAFGARAVAVATGPYDILVLEKTGAEVIVPDLSDWAGIWRDLALG